MSLRRSIATVGGWTLVSRAFGFVRDVLMAGSLGTGLVADAFFVAFKLPNFFRRFFGEGAFNAAFVPLFGETLTKEGRYAARFFAGQAATILIATLMIFTLLALTFMPLMMHVIAPGFSDQPEKFQLTTELSRITFPYLIFMALIALLGGVLNSLQRFAATAATPILLNLMMIIALMLYHVGIIKNVGFGLAWAVTAAGIGQFLWIVGACTRADIMIRLPRPRLTIGMRKLLRLMVPGLVGAGAVQINLVVDVVLATMLIEGSVSYLYFADRLNQLPLGVVGIAVGTVLLPLLTEKLSKGDESGAAESQNRAIEYALFFTLPAAAALIVIADPIVSVLFERGAFDAIAVDNTAAALEAFAMGLPAYVVIKALTPGFFARQDTTTPVKVAILAMIFNVIAAVVLMSFLAHVGIALATAVSAWVNSLLLASILWRRGHLSLDHRILRNTSRAAFAACGMASILFFAKEMLLQFFIGETGGQIVALALLLSIGLITYILLCNMLGIIKVQEIRSLFGRQDGS